MRREELARRMLDRLISGAGAATDAADRLVRAIGRGGAQSLLGHRPGSVVVAGACLVLAALLALVGIEATDNPEPITLTPSAVAASTDIGSRSFATIAGSVSDWYVETYTDENSNGEQDEGETGVSWFYFLVDPATGAGLTVRSEVSPDVLYRFDVAGVVVEDATYLAEDVAYFKDQAAELGFTLDASRYVDATQPIEPTPAVLDLANGIPAADTTVHLAGLEPGGYLTSCSVDIDHDGSCSDDEIDLWDLVLFDPKSGVGVTVLLDENPEFTPSTFTGMLRRDERSVSEAEATVGQDFRDLGFDISDVYLLDAGTSPASAPLAFGGAIVLAAIAGVLLIGLAGGYLIYRRGQAPLPAPASTLAIGERIPLRVTGVLRTSGGLVHVREVAADLVRFQTGDATASDPVTGLTLATPDDVTSTLILERQGRHEGVALGLGELIRVSSGAVRRFRGDRPAIRATAGTGPLLLSFDSVGERDRAAAELIDEAGLPVQASGSAHA